MLYGVRMHTIGYLGLDSRPSHTDNDNDAAAKDRVRMYGTVRMYVHAVLQRPHRGVFT